MLLRSFWNTYDGRGSAAVDGHGDPAGLAGVCLARHRGRPGPLGRPPSASLCRCPVASRARCRAITSGTSPRMPAAISGSPSAMAAWLAGSASPIAFTVYRHDPDSPIPSASDSVRTLLVDRRGHVWIGTTDARCRYSRSRLTGGVRHLRSTGRGRAALSSDRIFTLLARPIGRCLDRHAGGTRSVASRGRVDHSVRSSGRRPRLAGGPGNLPCARRQERRGVGGQFQDRPDPSGSRGTFARRPIARAASRMRSATMMFAAFSKISAGRLWVGTADGLELLDRASGHFTHFRHDDSDANSLLDSFVMSLYEDQSRCDVDRHAHWWRESLESAQVGTRWPASAAGWAAGRSMHSPTLAMAASGLARRMEACVSSIRGTTKRRRSTSSRVDHYQVLSDGTGDVALRYPTSATLWISGTHVGLEV